MSNFSLYRVAFTHSIIGISFLSLSFQCIVKDQQKGFRVWKWIRNEIPVSSIPTRNTAPTNTILNAPQSRQNEIRNLIHRKKNRRKHRKWNWKARKLRAFSIVRCILKSILITRIDNINNNKEQNIFLNFAFRVHICLLFLPKIMCNKKMRANFEICMKKD